GWADNGGAQVSTPTNLNHVLAIAAGYNSSLALKSDTTVTAWGDGYGEAFNSGDFNFNGLVALAAGSGYGLALTTTPGVPPQLSEKVLSANQIGLSWSNDFGGDSGLIIERQPTINDHQEP